MAPACEIIKLDITTQNVEEVARDKKMAALIADGWSPGPFWSISEEDTETGAVKVWFLIMMIPPPTRIEAIVTTQEPSGWATTVPGWAVVAVVGLTWTLLILCLLAAMGVAP